MIKSFTSEFYLKKVTWEFYLPISRQLNAKITLSSFKLTLFYNSERVKIWLSYKKVKWQKYIVDCLQYLSSQHQVRHWDISFFNIKYVIKTLSSSTSSTSPVHHWCCDEFVICQRPICISFITARVMTISVARVTTIEVTVEMAGRTATCVLNTHSPKCRREASMSSSS